MNLKFIKSGERKRLLEQLKEQFGITELPPLLIETGGQKVRGFSGHMNREELRELTNLVNVEVVGLYLFKKDTTALRLGLDGAIALSNQITQGIVELDETQAQTWLRGENLSTVMKRGMYAVRYNNDFLGCGISNGEILINHVPKERRVRNSQ